MSTFVVQSVETKPPFTNSYGTFYPVQMAGILDGQIETSASLNVKDPTKYPTIGSTIECLIEKRDTYGVKIKKMPPPPPLTAPVAAHSEQGAPASLPPYQREDPTVRQRSIERQNSLTNAIAFCLGKAKILTEMGHMEDALAHLEGKKILQVATYFNRYNNGKLTVVMTPEEVAMTFGYAHQDEEPLPEERPHYQDEEYV